MSLSISKSEIYYDADSVRIRFRYLAYAQSAEGIILDNMIEEINNRCESSLSIASMSESVSETSDIDDDDEYHRVPAKRTFNVRLRFVEVKRGEARHYPEINTES